MADSTTSELSEDGKNEILTFIDDAIPLNQHDQTMPDRIPKERCQEALDVLWELMKPTRGPVIGVKYNRTLLPRTLRRLTMKITVHHNRLPQSFYLKGVKCSESESRGAGGFADVYYGEWEGQGVALKRLRVETRAPQADESLHKQFCRESLLWMNLDHEYVLPFYGVSEDAFALSICMVLPWMNSGNIRHHMGVLRQTQGFGGQELVHSVNKWLHQIVLGLIYLHGEDLVHGDLHGGNILIDVRGNVRLTDFGMGLLADATPHNYASKHGGGAFQYRAPELHDPEEFDLEDNRPTIASDIYALACVCFELYTEHVPFEGATYFKVCKEVVGGKRPPRPVTKDGIEISDVMWKLTEGCWSQLPKDRPSTRVVADKLRDVIASREGEDGEVTIETPHHRFPATGPAPRGPPAEASESLLSPPLNEAASTVPLVEAEVESSPQPPPDERPPNSSSVATKLGTQTEETTPAEQTLATPEEDSEPSPSRVAASTSTKTAAPSATLSEKRPPRSSRKEDDDVHKSGCSCIIA